MARLERKGRRELTGSVAAVAALRGEERPLEGEVLGETAAPLVWDGCEWALLLEALLRLRLDLRRSSPRSCTGYGLAARFFGLGGGTTPAWPDFSSFRKNFCAWLRTCHHHARHQHHMTCRPTDALTAEPTVLSRMIEASKRRSMNAVAKTHEIIVLRQKGRQLPGRCQSPSKPRTTVRNGREKADYACVMIANHFAAAECANKTWMRGKCKDIGPSGSHSHPWSNPRLPALNRKIAPEDSCLQPYRPAQGLRRTAERHREAGLNCSATGGAPMGPNTMVLGRNEGLRALQRSSECLQHSFCTLEGHKPGPS